MRSWEVTERISCVFALTVEIWVVRVVPLTAKTVLGLQRGCKGVVPQAEDAATELHMTRQ